MCLKRRNNKPNIEATCGIKILLKFSPIAEKEISPYQDYVISIIIVG